MDTSSQSQHLPVIAVMMTFWTWVSIDESESPKDNDYVPVPLGSYLSPEAFNQELTEDKEVE